MTIPDFQSIMLPLLNLFADEQEHSLREIIDSLSETFALSEEERAQLLPSGKQSMFNNRVSWAKTHLTKAGLLKTTKRGYFQITQQGLKVWKEHPPKINNKFLQQFPKFIEFKQNKNSDLNSLDVDDDNKFTTPEEELESAFQKLNQTLASDLIEQIKSGSPRFFEMLVVDLLVKMGYGGTRKDAGQVIGRSGDEGVDGLINEDRLGLDVIYIQAKRWQNPVGRPEIQKFTGALEGFRAKKGIFITSSSFTNDAQEYVERIDKKVILIDGDKLAQLMIEYNVGVSPVVSYEIKKVDLDYFMEE
ncbi:restriction endonuclease [Laspinema olomoucense]|uniref:restriction endonuclease n=1 Tax=Laspinema olomoucense TaxID=3231600 RepID=UPI0021BB1CF7|nr:restriction endonuclease [Laspinema sp. D3c]MCT7997233.1 restriction endonuclease [Laspinema sp. D3c]